MQLNNFLLMLKYYVSDTVLSTKLSGINNADEGPIFMDFIVKYLFTCSCQLDLFFFF